MVKLSVLGDRCLEDLLGEIIGTNVPTNGNGVSSKSFDLLNDKLSFLFIKAVEIDMSIKPRGRKTGQTYSLTTTFAPSLAKMIAALLPIPYEKKTRRSMRKKGSGEALTNLGSTWGSAAI